MRLSNDRADWRRGRDGAIRKALHDASAFAGPQLSHDLFPPRAVAAAFIDRRICRKKCPRQESNLDLPGTRTPGGPT